MLEVEDALGARRPAGEAAGDETSEQRNAIKE